MHYPRNGITLLWFTSKKQKSLNEEELETPHMSVWLMVCLLVVIMVVSYAALPQLQPAYYQPQQHINLQAARREEERRRVERWMLRVNLVKLREQIIGEWSA